MGVFKPTNINKLRTEGNFKALTKALSHKDISVRTEAIDALVQMGEGAIESLIDALWNSDSTIRGKATKKLVDLGESSIAPLIDGLSRVQSDISSTDATGTYYDVSWPCIEPLVLIGADLVPPLIEVLKMHDTPERCHGAAMALGRIGDQRAVKPLAECLEEGHCPPAAIALGLLGDPLAVEPLINYLEQKTSKYSQNLDREHIIIALGKIGDQRAVSALAKVLCEATGKYATDIADGITAIDALRMIGDADAVEPLIEVLSNKVDYFDGLRLLSAIALGELRDRRSVQALINALTDDKKLYGVTEGKVEYVCVRAAEALGLIGNPEAIDALIAGLSHKNKEMREGVIKALGLIGDRRAETSLQRALDDKEQSVREVTKEALALIRKQAI